MTVEPLCVVEFGARKLPVVATLGDPLASTCSIEFAKAWLAPEGGTIKGYATFEEAAEAVLSGTATYLLVPGAYPRVREFIFESALRFDDQFVDRLPTIVLVSSPLQVPTIPPHRMYFHGALTYLVSELEVRWGAAPARVEVASNPLACVRVLENPDSLALTNAIAAKAYGVKILETLREEWEMPCVVFRAESAPPSSAPDLRPYLGRTPSRAPVTINRRRS